VNDLTGRAKDRRAAPDKPLDKDDHLVECERRGCSFVNDVRITSGPTFLDGNDDDWDKPKKKREVRDPTGKIMDVDFEELKSDNKMLPYNSPEDL
jgi:hypothetical protein